MRAAPRPALRGTWLALLAVVCAAVAPAQAAGDLAATRALVKRLAASGRGEATITMSISDPLGGPDRVVRGRLALEPPDRVRLDFTSSGERIALRGDGGEWIQPPTRQMLRLDRDQAGTASWLWEVFLKGGTAGFTERSTGTRRFVLEPRQKDGALPEAITVVVDANGLPARIEYVEAAGTTTRHRFAAWRFTRPRGRAAFTLSAPRGYAVVDLP